MAAAIASAARQPLQQRPTAGRAATLQLRLAGLPSRRSSCSTRRRHASRVQASKQQQQQQQPADPAAALQELPASARGRAAATPPPAPAAEGLRASALPLMEATAAITLVPLLLPQAASASAAVLAALVPHSLHPQHASDTLMLGCTALGAASLLVTLVCTTRFLISFFPGLEREAEQRRWQLPWAAATLFDPLLQPVRRRYFGQTEEGDLDYAALALLAIICSLLEILFGRDGLLNYYVPDFELLQALQFLIVFMHGQLMPAWCMVVLRWGRVL